MHSRLDAEELVVLSRETRLKREQLFAIFWTSSNWGARIGEAIQECTYSMQFSFTKFFAILNHCQHCGTDDRQTFGHRRQIEVAAHRVGTFYRMALQHVWNRHTRCDKAPCWRFEIQHCPPSLAATITSPLATRHVFLAAFSDAGSYCNPTTRLAKTPSPCPKCEHVGLAGGALRLAVPHSVLHKGGRFRRGTLTARCSYLSRHIFSRRCTRS